MRQGKLGRSDWLSVQTIGLLALVRFTDIRRVAVVTSGEHSDSRSALEDRKQNLHESVKSSRTAKMLRLDYKPACRAGSRRLTSSVLLDASFDPDGGHRCRSVSHLVITSASGCSLPSK